KFRVDPEQQARRLVGAGDAVSVDVQWQGVESETYRARVVSFAEQLLKNAGYTVRPGELRVFRVTVSDQPPGKPDIPFTLKKGFSKTQVMAPDRKLVLNLEFFVSGKATHQASYLSTTDGIEHVSAEGDGPEAVLDQRWVLAMNWLKKMQPPKEIWDYSR